MPRKPEDPYAVLGVDPSASDEMIKAAFKARAKELHPDRNIGHDSTEEFQRIQAAYAVVGTPQLRKLYEISKTAAIHDSDPSIIIPPDAQAGFKKRFIPVFLFLAAAAIVVGIFVYGTRPILQLIAPDRPKSEPIQAETSSAMDQRVQATETKYVQNIPPRGPSSNSEVVVEGRDGHKFVLSYSVAKRLVQTREKLISVKLNLDERSHKLTERRTNLEHERERLDPSEVYGMQLFNQKEDAFKHDLDEYTHDAQAHDKAIDAFFGEIERLALRDSP